MEKVFVYGTLKEGFGNHVLLHGSNFLGPAKTEPEFNMYSLGGFPGVKYGDSIVHGEVYEVDRHTFKRLDSLEGYPSFYTRDKIETEYGSAWIYIYNGKVNDREKIINGIWRKQRW